MHGSRGVKSGKEKGASHLAPFLVLRLPALKHRRQSPPGRPDKLNIIVLATDADHNQLHYARRKYSAIVVDRGENLAGLS